MIEIIQQKLDSYEASNPVQEEQATKEIMQEIALYGLWRAGFFEVGAFQGGTSLRILHGLPRFSEDLDFMLQAPDQAFDWSVTWRNCSSASKNTVCSRRRCRKATWIGQCVRPFSRTARTSTN